MTNPKSSILLNGIHLIFIVFTYVFIIWPFFNHKTFSLGFDNMGYHFPEYVYFSNSLLHRFGIPRWYPFEGGVPTGITFISMFSLVPHRIFGYILYILLPFLQPITLYKINVVLGMAFICFGWWLFLYQLIKSRFSATIGCLALFLGGSGIVFLHMEQSIATMTYIPYILLALINIKKRFSYTIIFAILCGFALTVHYPFHAVLTLLFLLIALILSGKLYSLFLREITKRKALILLLSIILLVFAASPLLYVIRVRDYFSTSVRPGENVKAETFDEYVMLNRGGSSAVRGELRSYTVINYPLNGGRANSIAFNITIIPIVLACIGIFYFRISIPVIIVLGFSAWATLGINSNLPYLLFKIKLPFINYFRQWWHFVHIVNFCLSILAALGFASVLYLLKIFVISTCKIQYRQIKYNNLLRGIMTLFTIVPILYYSKLNSDKYMKIFSAHVDLKVQRFTKKQFCESLKSNLFAKPSTLFMYKEWREILNECPGLTTPWTTSKRPFITRNIFNDINIKSNVKTYIKEFCREDLRSHAVIASIPMDKIKGIKMSVADIFDTDTELKYLDSTNNYYLTEDEYALTPKGANLKVKAPTSGFLVFPYCYKLGLKAYLDNKRIETYPVFNGAMTGAFVPEGKFNLDFTMPFSIYEISLVIQWILVVFIFCYLIIMYYKSQGYSGL